MKILIIIQKVNPVRPLASALVGKHHTFRHRACAGIAVMLTGVLIAKTVGHHDSLAMAMIGDAIGYGLHGIGLMPFIEALLEKVSDEA